MDQPTDAAAAQAALKAAEAVAHLQAAALELIAAARSTLDVLEDAVQDPGRLAQMLASFAAPARERRQPDDPGDDGVQRIRVS